MVAAMSDAGANLDNDRDASGARQARRVTLVGLAVNTLLTAFKFAAGILGRSQAVVADAVHGLSDMLTDVMILVGVRYWTAPPDESHPYGHRRIETVITTVLGISLAGVGVGLGYRALSTIREEHVGRPAWIAFAAAALAIVVKEVLYRWTVAVGKRIRSAALVANAWHHRSDALSSVPAALAVAAAVVRPSWVFLDHVGAAVVAIFILQASWKIMAPALAELIDAGAPREAREKIRAVALGVAGVELVHAIRTRYIGSGLVCDLHVKVDPAMSVRDGHAVTEEVKRRLLAEGPDVLDVVVHLEPYTGPETGPPARAAADRETERSD